jgi:hypothetical protein
MFTILKNKDKIQSDVLCNGRPVKLETDAEHREWRFGIMLIEWLCHGRSTRILNNELVTNAKINYFMAHFKSEELSSMSKSVFTISMLEMVLVCMHKVRLSSESAHNIVCTQNGLYGFNFFVHCRCIGNSG